MGYGSSANSSYSLAGGFQSTTTGAYSIAFGFQNNADGGVALGGSTIASAYAFAMGYGSEASGSYSFALGYQTLASGDNGAIALGSSSEASGVKRSEVELFREGFTTYNKLTISLRFECS